MVAADFIVGILGNIISVLSFASPIGTFREMVKKKSAENYDGLPYITTLLSTSLWTLYGVLDPDDGVLIATVNGVGVASQIIYLILYLYYSSKGRKVKYFGFVILDVVFLGTVIAVTLAVFHGGARRTFVGVLCATFTIVMYAAPLSVMKTVVKTQSVEYMPFFLSFSLFVNAGVWFTFAMLLMDYYVLVPNAVGIVFGSAQLIIYFIYKNKSHSSKLTQTIAEEGSPDMGIKMQDLNEDDKPNGKNQNLNNGVILHHNHSVSRQHSFTKIVKPLSLRPHEQYSNSPHEKDVENGDG